MAKLIIDGLEDLKSRVGQELGVSDWVDVTQERINAFADATGDHQFIHVDPERAAQTPFGGTIAHGLYTLSLGPALINDVYEIKGIGFAVNYGYNKVRFPAPVPSGSRVRMRVTLSSAEDVNGGGVQMVLTQTYEVEGGDKPVCVAEHVVRVYPAA
jgi:acyl dehydratase